MVASDRRLVVVAVLLHGPAWLLAILMYFSARAVGLSVPIGVAMITVALTAVAGVVPVPAGLGATEVAFAGLLGGVGTVALTVSTRCVVRTARLRR